MKLTFGSLFAGIGGFDLGFERAGFECRWQVEIDNYATKILEKHWPKVHRQRDIRECNASNLERVDCIIGGFPCQDISYAGRGAGLDGDRSGLFFEAIRLVRELQPRAIVLENVAALLTRGLDRVLGTLAEIGYDAEWHCIPAAAVGAPHIRDRVFVIAVHPNPETVNARQSDERNAKQCGADCPQERQRLRNQFSGLGSIVANAKINRRRKRELDHGGGSEGIGKGQEHRLGCSGENVADSNELIAAEKRIQRSREFMRASCDQATNSGRRPDSHWAVEPAVGRVANGIPSRVDRLRCLGNAIVPQVAEVVARMTLERLGS